MGAHTYIGIDPGTKGAIAWESPDGVWVRAMPATREDLIALLQEIRGDAGRWGLLRAAVEKVGPMPGEGLRSAATFAANAERVLTALAMLEIPVREVLPRKWQQLVGAACPDLPPYDKQGDAKARRATQAARKKLQKRHSQSVAQQRWPHADTPTRRGITLELADALHLLEACKILWR